MNISFLKLSEKINKKFLFKCRMFCFKMEQVLHMTMIGLFISDLFSVNKQQNTQMFNMLI